MLSQTREELLEIHQDIATLEVQFSPRLCIRCKTMGRITVRHPFMCVIQDFSWSPHHQICSGCCPQEATPLQMSPTLSLPELQEPNPVFLLGGGYLFSIMWERSAYSNVFRKQNIKPGGLDSNWKKTWTFVITDPGSNS